VQFDLQHPHYDIGCYSTNLTTKKLLMMQYMKRDIDYERKMSGIFVKKKEAKRY
jgi:hypothetical protein